MAFFFRLNKKVYCSNVGHSFHSTFRPALPVPRLLGMSLFVVSVECRHVALEVLLQLVEGAHCLIECPQRKRGKKWRTSAAQPQECRQGSLKIPTLTLTEVSHGDKNYILRFSHSQKRLLKFRRRTACVSEIPTDNIKKENEKIFSHDTFLSELYSDVASDNEILTPCRWRGTPRRFPRRWYSPTSRHRCSWIYIVRKNTWIEDHVISLMPFYQFKIKAVTRVAVGINSTGTRDWWSFYLISAFSPK